MLSSREEALWDLKEAAKWSLDVRDRKRAIMQLAKTYGTRALDPIAEINDVSAYDEIRQACMEAIKVASRAGYISKPARKRTKASKTGRARKVRKPKRHNS